MRIIWIGQSGYVISTGTTQIILDPYLSDAVNRVAGRPRMIEAPIKPHEIHADAIICTHNHLDHLDVDAIAEIDRDQHFITTEDGRATLQKMGFSNVCAVKVGQTVIVGDVEITAVFSKHTVESFGVIIKAEGNTFYFSGDTLYDERLFEIADFSPDIAFVCINGKLGNMNVQEAAIVAKHIGAKTNIPNHYGMFASNTERPELFTSQVENGLIMEMGKEYCVVKGELKHVDSGAVENCR